jgi:hypothetical protein
MSKYLDFLAKIDGYESIEAISGAVQQGQETGDYQGVIDVVNGFLGNNRVPEEKFAPPNYANRHGTSGEDATVYTANKAFVYPGNLFENGNTPYILFYMKDSESAKGSYDKFAGSQSAPHARLALYMPPAVRVNYGAKWEEATLNLQVGSSLMSDAWAGSLNGVKQVGAKVADALFQTGNTVQNEVEFANKSIIDPKNARLFKGVNFRRFQFDFQLMARNAAEAESIRQIIKAFKYGMHPGSGVGEGSGGAMWSYPHFFEIFLCTPTRKYMFNIMNAALEEMDVDYGGSGIASFFRENGAPVDIRLSLQFKELFVLTKELILKDY